ncbi:MAG TPA: response regulator, partial [Rhodocyclaceae bacterium]|nr:response regulator [Rhodocyclaceae bacterium]
ELRAERLSVNGADVHLVVRDTGIGIPKDKQESIFEAFSQADVSTTRRYGGTGLGLAITQRLVQLMEGQVWLESEVGKGTAFHVVARLGVEPDARTESLPPGLAGKRVLVVDDHPQTAQLLVSMLDCMGMQASPVSDAKTAVEVIERARAVEFPYDFIILDAGMAPPAGFALVDSWDASRPEQLMVLLTSENQRQDLQHLRKLGVKAHLIKPVGREDLLAALELLQGPPPVGEGFDFAPFAVEAALDSHGKPGLKVLLAEDNPVNQELAVKLLEKRGHRVTIANNGAEALDSFEEGGFDVILMDMQMPVIGGLEAAEAIRAKEMRRSWVMSEQFRPVYIIAMTANVMDSDRHRCLEAGMNDFIPKPLTVESLDAALNRAQEIAEGGLPGPDLTEGDLCVIDLTEAMSDLGDVELLRNMAKMLLAEWDGHLARIKAALSAKDAAELRLHAHTLKSLLAIFHADRARRAALELERAAQEAKESDWRGVGQHFFELQNEMEILRPELQRFADGLDPS